MNIKEQIEELKIAWRASLDEKLPPTTFSFFCPVW